MREIEDRFPIEIIMVTYIMIYTMYIVTFSRGSGLFFAFFILERFMAFQYDEQLDGHVNNINPAYVSNKILVTILILTFSQIGIFIYAFFKYPSLFTFLIIGELIDLLSRKLKNYIKRKP